MHTNANPLCIQRNLVHRTRKEKKSHGKIRQRTVPEVAMHSHATSRECFPTRNHLVWPCHSQSWGGYGDCAAFPTHLSEAQGRAQDGQRHAPKSPPAYHTSSLYCGKDEKETAIILPPGNMSLIFKLNYMHQIQKTKLQFTGMSNPPVNELPQQSRKHSKGKPLKRRQSNWQNLKEPEA